MKTFTLEPTKHLDLFRVVDRDGNWEHYWLKSKNLFLRGVTTVLERGYAKGAFFEEWLAKITPTERDAILKATGERGDKVHRAIDSMLTFGGDPLAADLVQTSKLDRSIGIYNRETKDYEKIENDEWDMLLSFARFWQAHAPIVLVSEASLYDTEHGYAGTTDAILILTKACDVKTCRCKDLIGKIGVWDWKTSSGIRPSYSAQGAAYAHAENIGEYLPPRAAVDYIAILRLGTNHKTTGGYELKSFSGDEMQNGFLRFIAAKMIADFDYTSFNPDADIADIPDELELTVQRFDMEKARADAKPAAEQRTKEHKARVGRAAHTNSKSKKDGKGKRNRKGAQHSAETAPRE